MTRLPYRWNYPEPVPNNISNNLDSFSPHFRSILFRRGCETIEEALAFLLPKKPNFSRAQDLGHIELACELIRSAVDNNHLIAVYGDYDTDGITATAVLSLALKKISDNVTPFIPNRLDDGYGLSLKAIDFLHQQGVSLLITVDNGIRSFTETEHAKSLGMKVIITDHHQPSGTVPDADAIINPKLPGDPYPNKNLAGVGVAYKLISGLAEYFPVIKPSDYLDLVALGTIADIVPLTGENRYLVKQGLIKINQRPRQSLQSIIGAGGLVERQIKASDISFQIAPRINSSGRLSGANHLIPLDLLLSDDPATCGNLAQILENHNERRKRDSREMLNRIDTQFSELDQLPRILISMDPNNDPGIAGIAAGYLTNKYYLPSIVGVIGQELSTASCRSIPEFDMTSVLSELKDLFTHFGGHTLAAGFTIDNQNLSEFSERIESLANSYLSGLDLHPTLDIDAIVSLSDLDLNFYRELSKLEPTGEGNPTPLFVINDLTAELQSTVGKSGEHLKLTVSDGRINFPAIAFGMGEMSASLPSKFDLACYFTENVYRGMKEFQLQIVDLKPAS